MRIFTIKERTAIASAFLRFMSYMDGRRATTKTYQKLTDKAIDYGLSLDIIFNPANYVRVCGISPAANAETYIDCLIDRRIDTKPVTEEPEWSSIDNSFDAIAESFHDFFQEICPRGGKWNSPTAMTNLAKAISSYGLQPIMSESLITATYGEDGSITCFNFLGEIVKHGDEFIINRDLTEAQESRLAEEAAMSEKEEEGVVETTEEVQEEPAPQPSSENPDEELPPNGLRLKNELEQNTVQEEENEEFGETDNQEEETEYLGETAAISVGSSPIQMKRMAVYDVISGLSPKELLTIASNLPESKTIADFVDLLTKGEITVPDTPEALMIHQKINIELIPHFVNCIRLQGMPMDDRNATELDILSANWDLRDERTRILQKLNYFINSDEDNRNDKDLRQALKDLEKYYSLC